jgi:hypothetical protein
LKLSRVTAESVARPDHAPPTRPVTALTRVDPERSSRHTMTARPSAVRIASFAGMSVLEYLSVM